MWTRWICTDAICLAFAPHEFSATLKLSLSLSSIGRSESCAPVRPTHPASRAVFWLPVYRCYLDGGVYFRFAQKITTSRSIARGPNRRYSVDPKRVYVGG
jgi:hypothetical protein